MDNGREMWLLHCPLHFIIRYMLAALDSYAGGVAQWLGRRSVAGGLHLIYA